MNSDSALTGATATSQAVSEALLADKALARYPIEVTVQGTTTTLSGMVDSQSDKEAAERIAHSVGGVVQVINELVVR